MSKIKINTGPSPVRSDKPVLLNHPVGEPEYTSGNGGLVRNAPRAVTIKRQSRGPASQKKARRL